MVKQGRRGSATLLALVLMMFLLIAGGGWLMMLTSEKQGAHFDEAEQRAWYAAEAGMKRAKAEIKAGNDNWGWLSMKADFSNPNMRGMEGDVTTDSQGLWYAVYVDQLKDHTVGTYTLSEDSNCDIIAIGSYHGTRKVLKDKGQAKGSGGESEKGSGEKASVLPGVVNAGSIDLTNSGGPSNMEGGLYANSFTGTQSYEDKQYKTNQQGAGYVDSLFTTIPSSWFITVEEAQNRKYRRYRSYY